ncbi:MAG: C4-dicarboxylate ABC transporter permease [Betaproteobacteria bacterium HGW-Betaproteobacteria-18]|nr:MAG: C4-dicarboxylate ABC transporter permease [Betaproteobacteria bacterium HGW-Betaproteobacteria-18]
MFLTVFSSLLIATAASGAALGAALGLTGFFLLHYFANGATSLAVNAIWNVFNSFTLSAIPLFILLGEILLHSGISQRAYTAFRPVFARVPGGLLHTNIAVCAMFGAVSGSSMSTAAAVGSVAYPEMVKRGYNKEAVVGSLAGGGTLGLLIPPSLSFLIYGALTETSIGRLFISGIVPGLMVVVMFMAYILFACLRNPALYPKDNERMPLLAIIVGTLRIWPVIALIIAIMGSIVFGFATPTESAGVGVVVAAVIAFIWGDLTPRKLVDGIFRSVLLFSSIGFVVLGATVLSQSVSVLGLPQAILESALAGGLGKYAVLLIIVIVYLVLGCFFDGLSLMVMTLPIVFPLMMKLGFDPIWLGVVITILIEVGQLTPPVGLNLSVLTVLTHGEVSLGRAAIAAMPYWIILLFAVAALTIFPAIATFLPDLVV